MRLSGQFSAIESLGCLLSELRIDRPAEASLLAGTALPGIAQRLTERLAWLPEPVTVIEFDSKSDELLLRSKTVLKTEAGTGYHEFVLDPSGLRMHRYLKPTGAPRQRVEMALTWETFGRLVDDVSEVLVSVDT